MLYTHTHKHVSMHSLHIHTNIHLKQINRDKRYLNSMDSTIHRKFPLADSTSAAFCRGILQARGHKIRENLSPCPGKFHATSRLGVTSLVQVHIHLCWWMGFGKGIWHLPLPLISFLELNPTILCPNDSPPSPNQCQTYHALLWWHVQAGADPHGPSPQCRQMLCCHKALYNTFVTASAGIHAALDCAQDHNLKTFTRQRCLWTLFLTSNSVVRQSSHFSTSGTFTGHFNRSLRGMTLEGQPACLHSK